MTDRNSVDRTPGSLADAKDDTAVDNLETTQVYQGKVFGLRRETVRLKPGDDPVIRERLDHPGATATVALRPGPGGWQDADLLVINQYRHPIRAWLWEIPAGLLDVDGEDYAASAARELAEEADLRAGQWDTLVDMFTSPGASNESVRIYLARDLSPVPEAERHHRVEEEAAMIAAWVPFDQALQAVHEGRIHSPTAVVGILAAASARQAGFTNLRPANAPWMR